MLVVVTDRMDGVEEVFVELALLVIELVEVDVEIVLVVVVVVVVSHPLHVLSHLPGTLAHNP